MSAPPSSAANGSAAAPAAPAQRPRTAVAPAPAAAGATGAAPTGPAAAPLIPSAVVLTHAAKISIEKDKPILLDYYADTVNGTAFLGEDQETKEQMLVKSHEEFTSLVDKVFKVGEDYIVMTENSLYIVSGKIKRRRIQAPALRGF
jgi:3-oxoacyl-ACP reductase-like protein